MTLNTEYVALRELAVYTRELFDGGHLIHLGKPQQYMLEDLLEAVEAEQETARP